MVPVKSVMIPVEKSGGRIGTRPSSARSSLRDQHRSLFITKGARSSNPDRHGYVRRCVAAGLIRPKPPWIRSCRRRC